MCVCWQKIPHQPKCCCHCCYCCEEWARVFIVLFHIINQNWIYNIFSACQILYTCKNLIIIIKKKKYCGCIVEIWWWKMWSCCLISHSAVDCECHQNVHSNAEGAVTMTLAAVAATTTTGTTIMMLSLEFNRSYGSAKAASNNRNGWNNWSIDVRQTGNRIVEI